jgi:hypothetical protein
MKDEKLEKFLESLDGLEDGLKFAIREGWEAAKEVYGCDNMACHKCVHSYKEYPYSEKDGKYFYCGLHSFGAVERDFFCKEYYPEK